MRGRGTLKAGLVALCATFALAGAGQAAAQGPQPNLLFINLHGNHNYSVQVRNFGDPIVYVEFSKGKSNAVYSAQGSPSPNHIAVGMLGYGDIDMTFKPKGDAKKLPLPDGCTGTPAKRQPGIWKGDVAFASTFSVVQATKAEGYSLKPGMIDECHGNPEGRPPVSLTAFKSLPDAGSVSFGAFQQTRKDKVRYEAHQQTYNGDVSINLGVNARGPSDSFNYDLDAHTASAAPPGPFTGIGSLADNAFFGDLAVTMIDGSTVDFSSGFTGSIGRGAR